MSFSCLSFGRKKTQNCFRVNLLQSVSPFLPCYQRFPLRGFVATQSLPTETGTISVPEGASFQGLGVETLYPALDQTCEGQAERPCL